MYVTRAASGAFNYFLKPVSLALLAFVLSRDSVAVAADPTARDVLVQKSEQLGIKLSRNPEVLEEKIVREIVDHRSHYIINILNNLSGRLKDEDVPKKLKLKTSDIAKLSKEIDRLQWTLATRLVSSGDNTRYIPVLDDFYGKTEKAARIIPALLRRVNPKKQSYEKPDNYNLVADLGGYNKSNERLVLYRAAFKSAVDNHHAPFKLQYGLASGKVAFKSLLVYEGYMNLAGSESAEELGNGRSSRQIGKQVPLTTRWVQEANDAKKRQDLEWMREIQRLHGLKK